MNIKKVDSISFYKENQSIDEYIKLIESKFNDIPLKVKDICQVINLSKKKSIENVEKAGLFVFGKQIGVTSFEDACYKLKLTPNEKILSSNDVIIISSYKLNIIIKALNDGWIPDWNNPNQYKYFPYFRMTSEGFSYFDTLYHATDTTVPSALYLKSLDLCEYCRKMFFDLYEKIYK